MKRLTTGRLIAVIMLMSSMFIGTFLREAAANGSAPLVENRDVYSGYESAKLTYLYVTIINDEKNKKTFSEINTKRYEPDEKRHKVSVIVQSGNSEGPDSQFSGKGTIRVRGKSTASAKYKSFQIKLDKNGGVWMGQTTINLNKHVFDMTRVRNKLSFDYFKSIPDITSLRTCFVNLWVKDMTDSSLEGKFVDYGVYTHVEQPNKQFLLSHGLDPKGHLYKAEFFEFFRYPEQLKAQTDPGYDAKKFEQILEINGNKDHKKLLKMLDDVNNEEIPISEVVEKHFNVDNLLTWLAVNLLVSNTDTNSQNFLLYSPSNSQTWYILPWDYDGAWDYYHQIGKRNTTKPKWHTGLSNYWGVVLFRRMFREPQYLQMLKKKMENLSGTFSEERTMGFLKSYYGIVNPFLKRKPDKSTLPSSIENYDAEYHRLAKVPEQNRQNFYKALEDPMPIFLGEPEKRGNKYLFLWDPSFDLQGDEITYHFQLSDSPEFKNIICEKVLKGTEYLVSGLEPGVYFWRVIVRDQQGNVQLPFDEYTDEKKITYFGVLKFVIK